jgi:hypothetical protein
MKQAHAPLGRFTVSRDLAILVPNADSPPTPLPRYERLAGVDDVEGLVRSDLARVPEVTVAGAQGMFRRRHENLEGHLFQAATGRRSRLQLPTEPGTAAVDAKGVFEVLATQVHRAQRGNCPE